MKKNILLRTISITALFVSAFMIAPGSAYATDDETMSDDSSVVAESSGSSSVEIDGDGIDNDGDGKTDEVNRGKHPEYEMEDVADDDRFDAVVKSFQGKSKGKVQIKFTDGSTFQHNIFQKATAEKDTHLQQLKGSGVLLAVRGNGRTIAAVNPYTGKKLDTAKLSLKRTYGVHSIKQYDLLADGSSEIIVISNNQKTITHITVLRYDEATKEFSVLSRKSMSGVMSSPKKTTLTTNSIILKDKKNVVLTTVTVNPDYSLQ